MSGERSSTPIPISDLSLSDYRSAPLRGTEARDRRGLGKQVFPSIPHDSIRNSVQFDSNMDAQVSRRDASHFQRVEYSPRPPRPLPSSQNVPRYPPRISTVSREHEPSLKSHAKPAGSITSSDVSKAGIQHDRESSRDVESLSKGPNFDENGEKQMTSEVEERSYNSRLPGRPNVRADTRVKLHDEVREKTPQGEMDKAKLGTAMDSLGNVWTQLISTVRQTLDKVKVPVSPSASPDHESVGMYTSNYYTERDVTNLINDIMQEIQMHQDEIRAHRDMLKDTGRWDSDELTQRERDAGVVAPMLVMRTSKLVSPDVLADAVTTSTTKLLLSKRTPMPWSVTSRLLIDLHSRLSKILEPLELVRDAANKAESPEDNHGEIHGDAKHVLVQAKTEKQKQNKSSQETMSTIRSEIYPIHTVPQQNHGSMGDVITS